MSSIVVDTSVLMSDKNFFSKISNANIILHLDVVKELDAAKKYQDDQGEAARAACRFLDAINADGNLKSFDNNNTISIKTKQYCDNVDETLIKLAKEENCTLLTNDVNLRIRARVESVNVDAWDSTQTFKNASQISTFNVSDFTIDELFARKSILLEELDEKIDTFPNMPLILKSGGKSALGIVRNDCINLIPSNFEYEGIKPKSKEQIFALSMLTDPNIPLVIITGIAGSGKTFLTLNVALTSLMNSSYEKIVFSRSVQPVGRDLGYLPGTIEDKMDVWIKPLLDNFPAGDVSYFNLMKDKGSIEISPMSYIRGRTFNDTFIIIDEAQNISLHELKTLITRAGTNTKVVLLGDTEQIDTPKLDIRSNGLLTVIERFKSFSIESHINLTKSERSDLAGIAAKIL